MKVYLLRFSIYHNEKQGIQTLLDLGATYFSNLGTLSANKKQVAGILMRASPTSFQFSVFSFVIRAPILDIMVLLKSHPRFASRPYARLSQISDLVKATVNGAAQIAAAIC